MKKLLLLTSCLMLSACYEKPIYTQTPELVGSSVPCDMCNLSHRINASEILWTTSAYQANDDILWYLNSKKSVYNQNNISVYSLNIKDDKKAQVLYSLLYNKLNEYSIISEDNEISQFPLDKIKFNVLGTNITKDSFHGFVSLQSSSMKKSDIVYNGVLNKGKDVIVVVINNKIYLISPIIK